MNEVATVGRTVHFVCPETKADRAAIVSEVTGDTLTLHVLRPPSSPHWHEGPVYVPVNVKFCPEKTPGTWHWPERV